MFDLLALVRVHRRYCPVFAVVVSTRFSFRRFGLDAIRIETRAA